jgi:hypothetical protein
LSISSYRSGSKLYLGVGMAEAVYLGERIKMLMDVVLFCKQIELLIIFKKEIEPLLKV